MAILALAMMAASTYEKAQASSEQATAAAQAADYNASVDRANAQQLAYDTTANIDKQRVAGESYMSTQRAQYAASGILSGTGSAMIVQATTAARLELNIQQQWTTAQEKEALLYGAATEGVLEGQEQASMYHLQGVADIFSGIGSMAGIMGSPSGQALMGKN